MEVRELVDAVRVLRETIQEQKLRQRLKALVRALNEATQNPQAVQASLADLKSGLLAADIGGRGLAETELLQEFGLPAVVGPDAVERIEQIFRENMANTPAIVSALQAIIPEFDQVGERADSLVKALGPMLDAGVREAEAGPDQGRLWLRFDHKVGVETMQQLPKAVERWNSILHHFSRVTPTAHPTARLILIRKHSPLVIEVAAAVAVLGPLTWGVNRVVNSLGRVIELGKKLEELKQMKAKTSVLEGLVEQIKDERDAIARQAADEVQTQFNADPEARNAVETGLKEVVKFIEGGGEMDVDIPATAAAGDGEVTGIGAGASLRKVIEGMRRDLLALPPRSEEGQ
jgi:hypothetical protein